MDMKERDITKQMVRTIKENSEKTIDIPNDELDNELEALRKLNSSITIDSFKSLPDDNNVICMGSIPRLGDFKFQFILNESNGIYVTTGTIQLNDEAINTINKLYKHYDNWVNEWSVKIDKEYARRED